MIKSQFKWKTREQRQNESQKAAIIDVKGYVGEDIVNCLILNLFLIVSFLIFILLNLRKDVTNK